MTMSDLEFAYLEKFMKSAEWGATVKKWEKEWMGEVASIPSFVSDNVLFFKKEAVADLLNRAADLLETGEYGWTQGIGQRGNDVCMGQAICIAATKLHTESTVYVHSLSNHVVSYVSKFLDGVSVPFWNDQEGRTVADVIDKLREMAKLVGEETETERGSNVF